MTWPLDPPHRIVAAVDGSSTSLRAADAAIAMAARSDAELVLLHVLDDELLREVEGVVPDGADARRRLQDDAEEILSHLAGQAAERGVACSLQLAEGDPPREIAAAARELDADLILVGKIGRRGVRRWMIGSVTRRLIESTRIPVVVIAAPDAAEA
ncbi:MAG: universal stress protein [Myxococcota bacterium]|nr:universal stress protein [Myxococcota bacterium]